MKPEVTEADQPEHCPHCNSSLLSSPIPAKDREFFAGNYFKREIGVEIPTKYDGVWFFQCPDCLGQWGGARSLYENKDRGDV